LWPQTRYGKATSYGVNKEVKIRMVAMKR